jgi:hypothetical protein
MYVSPVRSSAGFRVGTKVTAFSPTGELINTLSILGANMVITWRRARMTMTDEILGRELAANLITFLETGVPPEGLFTHDAFCDFTMPLWRPQFQGDETDSGDVLDASALNTHRRRLKEIDAELDEADVMGDQPAAERLLAERDALLGQLRDPVALAGRSRRGGASAERARIAVRKAIAAAINQVDRHDPGLARLLRDSIRTGGSCRYDPSPDQPLSGVTK